MRIAIPNKGILYEPTLKLLEEAGIGVNSASERSLSAKSVDGNVSFLFGRAQDIPLYVASGTADAGITGYDTVRERNADVEIVADLPYGACRIAVAVPNSSSIKVPEELAGKKIATKMPSLVAEYFAKKGIRVELLELAGAIELAPNLGLADAIVDHVSTGATLAANNLRIIDVLMESTACLIANKKALEDKKAEIDALRLAFEGIARAKGLRYVMLNVTSYESLRKVLSTLPSMESPTVLQLAKQGEYAVHSVVKESEINGLVVRLKKAGAKDILVLAMERVIP
jgi:ATP phosphoribosyltransferase